MVAAMPALDREELRARGGGHADLGGEDLKWEGGAPKWGAQRAARVREGPRAEMRRGKGQGPWGLVDDAQARVCAEGQGVWRG